MSAEPDRDVRRARWTCLAAVLLIALACASWLATVRDVGLVGHDSYPIVVTSRVRSFGELASVFSAPLMDGRYPSLLYRPLLDLSVATDHALFGLAPLGYQVQSVLWLAGCALLVFLLARCVLGRAAIAGPLAASFAFVVFPWNLEVVPVLARRPESMCACFLLAALWAQVARAERRMPILPAALGLCAMGAKEPGVVAPLLCFVAASTSVPAESCRDRLRRAGLALVPHAVALALYVAVRTAVLGGLGGHAESSIAAGFTRFPAVVAALASELFVRPTAGLLPSALAGGLALVALAAGLSLAVRGARRGDARALRLATLGLVWLLAICFLLAASTSTPMPWYYTLPAVGGALLLAGALEPLAQAARSRGASRVAAAVCALLLLATLAGQTQRALRAASIERWARATTLVDAYLDELREIVLEVPANVHGVTLQRPFEWMHVEDPDPAVAWTPVLADYSVQAWLDLTLPERPARIVRGERPPAEPGVLLIELVGDGAKLPRAHSE